MRIKRSLLKYLLFGIGIVLLITWGQGNFVVASTPTNLAQNSPSPLEISAQSLTAKGHEQLALGKAEAALLTWEEAEKIYTQLKYQEGITGSRINQSLALQALGQYRRACKLLVTSFYVNNEICESSTEENKKIPDQENTLINVLGLRSLGDVLLVIGKLEQSQDALLQSLKMAQTLNSPSDTSAALLSLGNLQRAFYNQKRDLYRITKSPFDQEEAQKKAKEALNYYLQVSYLSSSKMTQLQAKVNRLSLLLEFEPWLRQENKISEAAALRSDIQSQANDLLQNQPEITNLPASKTAIYLKLNFAQSLSNMGNNELAIQYAQNALEQANTLEDKRVKAYNLGVLGGIYEQIQNLSQAQNLTSQATNISQSIQAFDINYQWQRQLGRIYQKQGKIEIAIAAYDVAIKDLDIVRKDLLSINPDVQFSFRDNVEPIYREFLELLLKQEASFPNNIDKASQVTESLQLAEIENFLQCGLLERDFVPIDKVKSPPAAIVYPIVLDERVEIIVKQPHAEKIFRYTTVVERKEINDTVSQLQGRLINQKNNVKKDVLPLAQKLYNWLIRPAIADLPQSGTLVFVMDSTLQSIPMAVLHDGNRYLVEKYSLAISLGSQLPDPKPLRAGKWNALIAGVSQKADSFPPNLSVLTSVATELSRIQDTVSSQKLLNRQFTSKAFQNQINATAFPVIHLATHGQFSSDPEQTYIYAWDEKIKVKQLDKLLRTRGQISREPIELLVLSACETAKGDERAALGIAGVALRVNTRSTVASLWQVDDGSTADFMGQLYRELNKKSMTKAEALRQVQINFLKDEKDSHPYYWAAFILAGSWL